MNDQTTWNNITARLWRDVVESLRSQPGRVGLSFLSVMVGIIVLTLLFSMLFGLRDQSHRLIRQFGANVAALIPNGKQVGERGYRGLQSLTDIMAKNLAPSRAGGMIQLSDRIETWNQTAVWACDINLPELRGWTVTAGRPLDHHDEDNFMRVALITDVTSRRYGTRVGDEFTVGPHAFQIIGILRDGTGIPDPAGLNATGSGERMALIPLATAERLGMPYEHASAAIFISTGEDDSMDQLLSRAGSLMRDPALATWQANWVTPETLIKGIRDLQRLIALTAGSVAVLCLVLGGTTLMSLMLADVRQRIPEIGLRRALGASRMDIALLFVAESCIITGAAAMGGIATAGILLLAISGKVTIPLSFDYFTFVIPVIISIVLGCMFSFWPARVASGLSPAQALRNA